MEREWSGTGRWTSATPIPLIHGVARWDEGDHQTLRDYLATRDSLPGQPDALPEDEIGDLAARLYDVSLRLEERQRILVFLARQGSARAASELQRFAERAEPRLRRFAEIALEEASQATAPAARCLGRNDPCPCRSGRKFKDCCARRLT